jgi:hypothetical protein
MKAYKGVDVWIHIFLTSALAGGEWSASHPCRFTPRERAPGTHWIGSWVSPRAGLDDVEKRKFLTLPGLDLRPLNRAARSQLIYRSRYSGCTCRVTELKKRDVKIFTEISFFQFLIYNTDEK